MKQIIALIILVFVFFGCTQRQTVQLKMPNKQNTFAKPAKTTPIKEDKITVVQELEPIDIIESDSKGKTSKKTETIKDEPVEYEVAPIIEGDKIESQPQSKPKGSSENQIDNPTENKVVDKVVDNQIEIDTTKVKMKVAFLYPSNLVSKYAKSSISTVSGYLSHQNSDYELMVIDTESESASRIDSAFQEVKKSNIKNVIALFTPNAVGTLNNVVSNDLKVYLPLIEKKEVSSSNSSLIFGSISYEEQVKKLVNYSSGNNVMFYQDTYLGLKLKKSYESVVSDTRLKKEISKHENNFKGIVTGSGLANSTLFLNTDIVKSSLILSQLRSYDIYPKVILSTQLSYDPLLMTLTQDKDRDKLIVANSIDVVDKELRDDIAISGGNIVYEWVDYSTLVGINYLYYGKNSNLVPTKIENNQAMYNPRLFSCTEFGFSEIK
ncbi:MAG: hypothetical protein PHE16_10765 [Aliarcobacter sp.]|nr:hypothetical protein [Aliarcobacter sp.]